MIRTSATVRPNRHSEDIAHRIFTCGKVARFRNFCHQLIDTRIDIICKLNFHNRLQPHSTHSYRGTNDIRLLDSGIKYPFISKFLSECYCFSKYASYSFAHILPVKKCLWMLIHQLLNGMNSGVHHDYLLPVLRGTGTHFFGNWRRSKDMLFH